MSIVIPARNEAKKIAEALQSVLKQDYPNLEFIVLNDRSTDNTATILAGLAAKDARLRVDNISELPAGWLGKNYALYRGAERASGDLLLFTDADVVMNPSAVSRAVHYLRTNRLDHLAVMPAVRMPTLALRLFCSAFGVFFSAYMRQWKAKDPRSPRFVGVGAFNLVARDAYRAIGTHQAIAMRPDDDIKLGKLLKKAGYRQELVFGMGMLVVEWYSSLRELIDGLMKNSFAGLEYSVPMSVAGGVAVLLLNVWPFMAIFCGQGPSVDFVSSGRRCPALVHFRRQSLLPSSRLVCLGASALRPAFRLHYLEVDVAHPVDRRHQLARHALSAGTAEVQSRLAP